MSKKVGARPAITVCEEDFDAIMRIALAAAEKSLAVAEEIISELNRAKIVKSSKLKPGIVRMGSVVTYSMSDGAEQTVTLVYPRDADISKGRVSIMTPIGAALIGLPEGKSIDVIDWSGRTKKITALKVLPAERSPT
ncbi:nucleoside diphosphate kinase regulator [Limoniibacter endophyticus]|uniref:Nucleoside diphosphate kinase regulator n=1 Tax=Limoniibacter endophyticus TaxID=1565040 RepID=A0A8J3DP94_9HYPH|nr:nucleoside diphosphate kinase regulator [Limoniibacter endophyticus]GHC68576.1 nucleoside diphosphate kinase regulator [Limoniibacter endophyticus]